MIQFNQEKFNSISILVRNVLLTGFIQNISSNFHSKFPLIRDKCSSSPSRNRYNSTESFSNLFVSSIHYYTPYRPLPVSV